MEAVKGKSDVNNALLGGSNKRAREVGEETTVTEEEVEEFFTILRKIHVAINYFKESNGDIRNLTQLGKVESLTLEGNVDHVNGSEKKDGNVDLDLNVDPDKGSNPF
ncbi:protein NIM1-INTERACTING 2-like [Durio zibethinus]|uniref:Protein NIM1-INTERACTING 2-like n=1 Tax=Durio zibethinus TaxID=66656 RepID=A0A6P5XH15_DURZI|nr:protein NIM1-INTERACTING 2-like [Durio zibethinus]